MSEYTPEPFEAINILGVWIVGTNGGHLIAKIPAGSINAEKIARLFAAAPDLLAALEALMDSQRGLNHAQWLAATAAAHAAIAKARGE